QIEQSRDPHFHPPVMEELKAEARRRGLWNLFLPHETEWGGGLSNVDYAPLAEITGRSFIAPEALNSAAPDTGNMEILTMFGTEQQQREWLKPLLEGEIRSCFAMTEPAVASSDATNIQSEIRREGDDYVINGRKWWTSGAMDPRCRIAIFMGKTNPAAPKHQQQPMILVPMDAHGLRHGDRGPGRDATLGGGVADGHRPGPAAHAAGGAHDGRGRQQGGARRDRHDQGRGPERRPARRRPGDRGLRGRRRQPGFS